MSTPADQAQGLYLRGQQEYLSGDFNKALATFEEVRKLTPADPRLAAAEGELYFAQGQMKEALAQFEQAVKLNPQRATNWSRLGACQLALGKRDDAQQSLDKALALNPKDFNALEDRATLLLKLGKVEEAITAFTQAAKLAPELRSGELYLDAANLLEESGHDPEALALLQGAEGSGLKDAAVANEVGDLQVKRGKLDEAAEAYRRTAQLAPKNPAAWEMVGRIEERLGKLDEAEKAYRSSLAVRNRSSMHLELAKLYLGNDQREKAKAELEQALDVQNTDGGHNDLGDSVQSSLELADLLSTFDRKPDALSVLRAIASEPGQEKDADLQLRTARLAHELRDALTESAACKRFRAQRPRDVCP